MSPSKSRQDLVIDRFWESVPPLWNSVRAHLRGTASGSFDISVEQFHVLRFVRRGMSMGELAAAKHISRPAISQAVDALVKKGLLARARSLKDRRCVELTLTAQGAALLDSVFMETRQWMKGRLGALSASELEVILRAFELLKKMLD